MIDIQVTEDGRYRVVYRLGGVVCSVMECSEMKTILKEVEHKMRMMMGLYRCEKILTTPKGRY